MSEKALQRIEKTLAKLGDQQDAICAEIAALRGQVDGIGGTSRATASEVITFLDQFRAGEALGEASLGAWIAVSDVECVRGGLRTVQMREGMHARLLEERIKELGGTPSFELPDAIVDVAMKESGDAKKGDAAKVADFVARFGDAEKALQPIHDMIAKLEHDPETQSLLQTICQDEASTLAFFNDACAQLNG